MSRIALLAPTFSRFSGIDRVVEDQARQLVARGDTLDIFSFEADMKPPSGANLRIIGMPKSLFWQRVYRLLLPLDYIKNSRIAIQLRNFDIVYSHQYPMNWLAFQAKKRFKVKYIYYDYGITPPEAFSTFAERIYMRIFNSLSILTAAKADEAISISRYLHYELKKDTGLISEVVYPRIDTGRFRPGIDSSAIKQKYGIANEPLVLYVGRISPHKGVHLLIQAFLEVQRQIPGIKLLIAGKHTFTDYSRRLISMSNSSIIFAGYVPDEDVPAYYAACSVYATATLWEGFDLPLAEAQACGKPVVAFNLGPHPEVVLEGKTGYLSPTGDVHAMAAAIRSLLTDDAARERMGKDAAEFVKEKFG
ncbi:MAG: glycosyltransferase family 4 protein [Chloroflexi bacterium]|nr:glycosyltransferase family 4 protein [Chloroflexota bacterium]